MIYNCIYTHNVIIWQIIIGMWNHHGTMWSWSIAVSISYHEVLWIIKDYQIGMWSWIDWWLCCWLIGFELDRSVACSVAMRSSEVRLQRLGRGWGGKCGQCFQCSKVLHITCWIWEGRKIRMGYPQFSAVSKSPISETKTKTLEDIWRLETLTESLTHCFDVFRHVSTCFASNGTRLRLGHIGSSSSPRRSSTPGHGGSILRPVGQAQVQNWAELGRTGNCATKEIQKESAVCSYSSYDLWPVMVENLCNTDELSH